MHVQRSPDSAFEHLLVHFVKLAAQGRERRAAEQVVQLGAQLCFPTGAQFVVLQWQLKLVYAAQPRLPQATHFSYQGQRLLNPFLQQLRRRAVKLIVYRRHGQLAVA